MRRIGTWGAWCLVAVVLLASAIAGYSITETDAERLRHFAETVERYSGRPEFRRVGIEYAIVGSQAVRTELLGINAGKVLYNVRRLPGFPKRYAAKESLVLHYAHFSEGPLSAYLHLTGAQGVHDGVSMVEEMGRQGTVSDEEAREFLKSFDVWPAISVDDGALASVRKLVADTWTEKGFAIRSPVVERLRPHIEAIARRHGWATEPAGMSVEQQLAVLAELDSSVKAADRELWRTKQVSDFLCGVWGSTFGRSYGKATRIAMTARAVGRVVTPVMLIMMGVAIAYRGRRRWASRPLVDVEGPLTTVH